MLEVRFHPEAREDDQVAYKWYQAQSPRPATRFEAELEQVLASIELNPGLYPAYDERHRFAMPRRFPFSVVDQASPGLIDVVALAHSRRPVGSWRGRD